MVPFQGSSLIMIFLQLILKQLVRCAGVGQPDVGGWRSVDRGRKHRADGLVSPLWPPDQLVS